MKSLVLIVPESQKAVGDSVAMALGHADADTYIIPLSASGQFPATHYGCHTWATEQFVDTIQACKAQVALPPAPWGAVGLSEADVFSMCGALILSIRDDGQHVGHFEDVIAANGLQRIPWEV